MAFGRWRMECHGTDSQPWDSLLLKLVTIVCMTIHLPPGARTAIRCCGYGENVTEITRQAGLRIRAIERVGKIPLPTRIGSALTQFTKERQKPWITKPHCRDPQCDDNRGSSADWKHHDPAKPEGPARCIRERYHLPLKIQSYHDVAELTRLGPELNPTNDPVTQNEHWVWKRSDDEMRMEQLWKERS